MAGIDCTYTKSWKEYQDLIKWAKDKVFVCPNGIKMYPTDYIYEWDKEDWDNIDGEKRVMNTSHTMDYFLIKHCPLQFVQDRMLEVYDKDFVQKIINETSEYDKYSRNVGTKVKIISYPQFGNKTKLQEPKKWFVWIEAEAFEKNEFDMTDYLHYNEDYDYWVDDERNELGYGSSNVAHKKIKSLKAMIRQIRKWKFPKGTIVTMQGRYRNNCFKFLVY